MSSLQLIKDAFQLKPTSRVPWVPFVGCHAGELIGQRADEFLVSKENIVNGVSRAIELYQPDGIPVVFDLQIEAEALGCGLQWKTDNPPAVVFHPLKEGKKLDDLKIPCPCKGRIPVVMDAARELKDKYPDMALYGLITGPFTLALHLLGTDIFMQMMMEPDPVHDLMEFATDMGKFMARQYIAAGCEVIAVVDPMTSQIDPGLLETFVLPYATGLFQEIRDLGTLSSFFVCGNATHNIELMCKCKPDNVSIDENISLEQVKGIALDHGISFGGNMRLTTVLLLGTEEDAMADALSCMDIAGKKGFILAPGCDLPMKTPPANLKAVTRLVHDEGLQGEVRASGFQAGEVEKLDLSGHWLEDKLMIDIITLDSLSCAPCQYMVDALKRAAEGFRDKVIIQEHKIKDKRGVQMMVSLGVQFIPAIVMDGKVEFSSRTPSVGELEKKIKSYLERKTTKA